MIKKILFLLSRFIAYSLIMCIWLIRPILGPMNICPYTIGCTQYALQQLQDVALFTACKNISYRLLACHPLGNRTLQ